MKKLLGALFLMALLLVLLPAPEAKALTIKSTEYRYVTNNDGMTYTYIYEFTYKISDADLKACEEGSWDELELECSVQVYCSYKIGDQVFKDHLEFASGEDYVEAARIYDYTAPTCECEGSITVEATYQYFTGLPRAENRSELLGAIPQIGHNRERVDYWNDTYHALICSMCYTDYELEEHYGGTATCTARAECKRCYQEYGNYKHQLTYQEMQPATCTEPMIKAHWKCGLCGKLFESVDDAGENSDVTLDGLKSGDPDLNNHAYESVPGQAATCEADGYKAHYQCTRCSLLFEGEGDRESVTLEELKIAGGYHILYDNGWKVQNGDTAATCLNGGTESQNCHRAGCGKLIRRDTQPLGHDWATALTQGEDTHYYACSRCTERKDEAAHSYGNWTKVDDSNHKCACVCGKEKTEPHTGGTATCVTLAQCIKCGEDYGGYGDHDWGEWSYLDEYQHARVCKNIDLGCNETDLEEHYGGTATCTRQALCEVCEHAYGEPLDHNWDTTLTQGEDTHYYACSRCPERKDEAEHDYNWTKVDGEKHKGVCVCGKEITEPHSGGAAACTSGPICDVCRQEYGESLGGHLWAVDTEQGDNGWAWAADGSSATVYLKCQRNGCGETATAEDTSPQIGNAVYNEGTDKADVAFTATVTVDGRMFNGATALSLNITSRENYLRYNDNDGSYLGHISGTASLDNWFTEQMTAYVDHPINCHYNFSGWSNPVFTGYEFGIPFPWQVYMYSVYATTAQYEATLTHVPKAPAACEEPGAEEYWTCGTCQKKYSDDKGENEIGEPTPIKKLGHQLDPVGEVPATCTEDGVAAYYKCTRQGCGKLFTDKKGEHETTLAALTIGKLGHQLEPVGEVPATCTEDGAASHYKCTRKGCGKLFTDKKGENETTLEALTIGKLGHQLEPVGEVPATCTEDGVTAYYKCTREGCGKLFSDEKAEHAITEPAAIKALGHDLIETKKAEPTCTEPGTEAYWTCRREGCGKKFSDKDGKREIEAPIPIAVDKNAHPADRIVTDAAVDATCVAPGKTEGSHCTACGRAVTPQKDVAINKENHLGPIEDVAGTPAACTETGLTDGKRCKACGAFTVPQEEIPALGHTEAIDPAVPATCTQTGLTAGRHCAVCGKTLAKQETVKALGHAWAQTSADERAVVYTCSRCGLTRTEEKRGAPGGLYGDILIDADHEAVRYAVKTDAEDKKTLMITAELAGRNGKTPEIGLRLTKALIWQLRDKGYDTIKYVNGSAALLIELDAISDDWFDGEEIKTFAFITAPRADGVLVRAEGETGDGEILPAAFLEGVTLLPDTAVEENGVY
ncbi:MAG: hypothetical protein IKQ41_13275 [Clostridia bacterium]|nr:hypothetical protein [Clostridia bacterium]